MQHTFDVNPVHSKTAQCSLFSALHATLKHSSFAAQISYIIQYVKGQIIIGETIQRLTLK